MRNNFAQTPSVDIPRSSFNRSHGIKTTFDAGKVVPVFRDFVLPGDTIKIDPTLFARLATPLYPLMDNMQMDFHLFSVPCKELWDNWTKFCGERVDYDDSIDFTIPVLADHSVSSGDLSDYLGLPITNTVSGASSLYHRAYNKIWNYWYRDQNQQTALTENTGDGAVS